MKYIYISVIAFLIIPSVIFAQSPEEISRAEKILDTISELIEKQKRTPGLTSKQRLQIQEMKLEIRKAESYLNMDRRTIRHTTLPGDHAKDARDAIKFAEKLERLRIEKMQLMTPTSKPANISYTQPKPTSITTVTAKPSSFVTRFLKPGISVVGMFAVPIISESIKLFLTPAQKYIENIEDEIKMVEVEMKKITDENIKGEFKNVQRKNTLRARLKDLERMENNYWIEAEVARGGS